MAIRIRHLTLEVVATEAGLGVVRRKLCPRLLRRGNVRVGALCHVHPVPQTASPRPAPRHTPFMLATLTAARAGLRTLSPLFSPTHFHEEPLNGSLHFAGKHEVADERRRLPRHLLTASLTLYLAAHPLNGQVLQLHGLHELLPHAERARGRASATPDEKEVSTFMSGLPNVGVLRRLLRS